MSDQTPLNAHQAWLAVMEDVRAIHKAEKNSQQGYAFRGIDAVMNAVGPIFRKYGVSCVPSRIVEAKHGTFTSKNGTLQHEAILTVEYRVTGPDGSTFLGESIGEASDSSDKATSQAMSVAYRTFLLQGLTMPTDSPDPDENTVDRATPWEEAGWASKEAQADAWKSLTGRAKELPDGTDKDELRAWITEEKLKPSTVTKDEANEFHRRLKAIEDAEPAAETEEDPVKAQGWKSKAERTKTMNSLMSQIGDLPAFEAEQVEGHFTSLGITGDVEDFTKEQSVALIELIEEAKQLVKETEG